jgi:hypothetical protein
MRTDLSAADASAPAADAANGAGLDGTVDATGSDAASVEAAVVDAAVDQAPPDADRDAPPAGLHLDIVEPDSALATLPISDVLVHGGGFTGSTVVRFGGVQASCARVSVTVMRCDLAAPLAPTPARVDVAVSDPTATSPALLTGGFTWVAESNDITWCDIQYPPTADATAGNPTPGLYGQVYQSGVTDTQSTPAASLRAQLGYGPQGADPRTTNAWRFLDAMPNPSWNFAQNNDEYYGHLTLPEGSYSYIFRFSRDGGLHYTYCDLNTANNGFDPNRMGTLFVSP